MKLVGENGVDRQRKEEEREEQGAGGDSLISEVHCISTLLFFAQVRQNYISFISIILVSYAASKNVPVNIKSTALFFSTES